jgi:hypothetical protein
MKTIRYLTVGGGAFVLASMREKILWKVCLPLLLACLMLAACESESDHRRPAKVYIPDGYVGWVRIEYDVPNAARLKTDFFGPWEYQKFPPNGLLQTSSELKDGAASADYFYYSGDNLKPLANEFINGGIIGGCFRKPDGAPLEKKFGTFFVGPKAEYEKHKQELERFRKSDCEYIVSSMDELPKVGNLATAAR